MPKPKPKAGKDKPNTRRKVPERRDPPPCVVIRLGLVIGPANDNDLDGAAQWLLNRAKALGGKFRLWHSRNSGRPLENFRDIDIEGGFLHAGATEHFGNPGSGQHGYGDVLADCSNCQGRVEELVIFHHGTPVDESAAGDRLVEIFRAIRVPVCRVVWWACGAAVSLDVAEGHWTDLMMRRLGEFSRCRPCGCAHPIELIWPTAGRCHLTGTGANDTLQTNDGNVNRAQWGYRWPDGSLRTSYPPPAGSTVLREPPDREPPFGQPIQPQPGAVLGTNVTRRS
jgi:hypothetical protein